MKRIFCLFFAVISVYSVFAQSSVWKVTNGDNVLYLGGSSHLLRAEDFPLPTEFDMAFDASQEMVFETDINSVSNPEIVQLMMMKSLLPEGKTLKSLLSDKVYDELSKVCAENNIPMENVQNIKPAMLMSILEMVQIKKMGFQPQGVDTYYFAKQMAKKGEWTHFESVEFQMDLLTTIGDGFEDEYVKYSLADMKNIEKELSILIDEWRKGNTKFISKKLKKNSKQFPLVYNKMFTERNANWMPQIEQFLQDDKVEFVVVGLGHLVGKDGLLKLLKNKGYKVEQLR